MAAGNASVDVAEEEDDHEDAEEREPLRPKKVYDTEESFDALKDVHERHKHLKNATYEVRGCQ